MFDTLQVHIWHRTFSPFVCRHCEHSTTYAVEGAAEDPLALPAARASLDGGGVVNLRCDRCQGITRFPRARIDHRKEIGEAVCIARSRGFEILPCLTCSGWGVSERATRLRSLGPWISDPCPECEGAGFLWVQYVGGRTWSYREILAARLTARSG
jgi:hypothetical protein